MSLRLRLSERWAFEAADSVVLRALVHSLRDEPLVREDLAGGFGVVMSDVEAFSIHAVRPMIVQTESHGCVRTSALLSVALKQLMERGRGPRPARIMFALAMARCLPFYYALGMLHELDTDDVVKLRFFRAELDEYTRNGVALGRTFLRELNASVAAPFERYKSLVRLTCRAYQTLFDLLRDYDARAVHDLFEQERQSVFMVHFPLAIDLHHVFTQVVPRRPARLSFGPLLDELEVAKSLGGLLLSRVE